MPYAGIRSVLSSYKWLLHRALRAFCRLLLIFLFFPLAFVLFDSCLLYRFRQDSSAENRKKIRESWKPKIDADAEIFSPSILITNRWYSCWSNMVCVDGDEWKSDEARERDWVCTFVFISLVDFDIQPFQRFRSTKNCFFFIQEENDENYDDALLRVSVWLMNLTGCKTWNWHDYTESCSLFRLLSCCWSLQLF